MRKHHNGTCIALGVFVALIISLYLFYEKITPPPLSASPPPTPTPTLIKSSLAITTLPPTTSTYEALIHFQFQIQPTPQQYEIYPSGRFQLFDTRKNVSLVESSVGNGGIVNIIGKGWDVGNYRLEGRYLGDNYYSNATSDMIFHTVEQRNTSISLQVLPSENCISGLDIIIEIQIQSLPSLKGIMADGPAQIWDGNQLLGSVSLNEGTGVLVTTLDSGTHEIKVTYSNVNYIHSPWGRRIVVHPAPSFIHTIPYHHFTYGNSSVIEIRLGTSPSASILNDIIQVSTNQGFMKTVSLLPNGSAFLSLQGLEFEAGKHVLNISYEGSQNIGASSYLLDLIVDKASSKIIVPTSVTTTFGELSFFKIALSSIVSLPESSTIQVYSGNKLFFKDHQIVLSAIQMSGVELEVGRTTLYLHYPGSTNITQSYARVDYIVNPASISYSISPSSMPVYAYSQDYHFKVNSNLLKNGVVNISIQNQSTKDTVIHLGEKLIQAGKFHLKWKGKWMNSGDYNMVFSYRGNSNFSSLPVIFPWNVQNSQTNTTLRILPQTVTYGHPISLEFQIQSVPFNQENIFPDGIVQIWNDNQSLGNVTLNEGGFGVLVFTVLEMRYDIKLIYNNINYIYKPLKQIILVRKAPTKTTITVSSQSIDYGQNVDIQFQTVSSSFIPDGIIKLFDEEKIIGSYPLDKEGNGKITLQNLASGFHRMTARYEGTNNFAISLSEGVELTVVRKGLTQPEWIWLFALTGFAIVLFYPRSTDQPLISDSIPMTPRSTSSSSSSPPPPPPVTSASPPSRGDVKVWILSVASSERIGVFFSKNRNLSNDPLIHDILSQIGYSIIEEMNLNSLEHSQSLDKLIFFNYMFSDRIAEDIDRRIATQLARESRLFGLRLLQRGSTQHRSDVFWYREGVGISWSANGTQSALENLRNFVES